jgi:hypothetical protein
MVHGNANREELIEGIFLKLKFILDRLPKCTEINRYGPKL